MTDTQIMKEFRDTGALLDGHFELRSKLHSNRYFQCANLLQFPRIAEKLCKEAVRRAKAAGFDGKVDAVVSPAIGGILVGHEVARELGVKCIFAEKVLTKGVDYLLNNHYSVTFHGIVGLVVASTVLTIPFAAFTAGVSSCLIHLVFVVLGCVCTLLLDKFNSKVEKPDVE